MPKVTEADRRNWQRLRDRGATPGEIAALTPFTYETIRRETQAPPRRGRASAGAAGVVEALAAMADRADDDEGVLAAMLADARHLAELIGQQPDRAAPLAGQLRMRVDAMVAMVEARRRDREAVDRADLDRFLAEMNAPVEVAG